MDVWAMTAGDPYMTFTVHFIDDKWELKSFSFQTHHLPVDHTSQNIVEAIQETGKKTQVDGMLLICTSVLSMRIGSDSVL